MSTEIARARRRSRLVSLAVIAVLAIIALLYRDALRGWLAPLFERGGGASSAPASEPARAPPRLADAAIDGVRRALAAYEHVRAALARDTLEGVPAQSGELRAALQAVPHANMSGDVHGAIEGAVRSASELSESTELAGARAAFGQLSRHMVVLATAAQVQGELHLFECPMAEGYQRWLQPSAELSNPYMGQGMLTCGSEVGFSAPPAGEAHAHAAGDLAYYTCSMHPSVKQPGPGKCPICAMELTPVTREEAASGMIVIDEARRQRIGVRVERVQERPLELSIRAVGEVRFDESRLHDVSLRMSGWVQKLLVDETGQRVKAGQTLFTLYSPELYAAQLEHLAALSRQGGGGALLTELSRASRQRLRLLGMTEVQITALEQRGQAEENLPIPAPAGGYVIEKDVIEGARVEAGMRVYRIADLSRVWIDAEIYESDLPHVRAGQSALVELPHVPGARFEGTVDYVYPTLDPKTRTARARIVLQNPKLELKPAMYANVLLSVDLGARLAVPASAVVYTGPRRLVFVDHGEGKLEPRQVELGVHAGGYYAVKSGLEAGEAVVTSGNFLIAAESRIRSAAEHWESPHDAH